MSLFTSAGVRVVRTWSSACASVFAPPQTLIHSGLGSSRSAARTTSSAPADILSGPTAAMPYAGCPAAMRASSLPASGHPVACFSRFGRTSPYAATSSRIVSGCAAFRCQVEVVATSPSMSISLE